MDRKTLRIVVAGALGGFIGALIALQLSPYLWWLGLLTGGLTSCIAYDRRAVWQALVKAWRATKMTKHFNNWWSKVASYRPHVPQNKWGWAGVALRSIYFAIITATGSLLLWITTVERFVNQEFYDENFLMVITVYLIVFVWLAGVVWHADSEQPDEIWGERLKSISKRTGGIITNKDDFLALTKAIGCSLFWPVTVLALIVFVVALILLLVWRIISALPMIIEEILEFAPGFCKNFFVFLLRDELLICFTSGAIGMVVGLLFGQAIIGLVAGGIAGFIIYEIVSKRWLKLVPPA